MLKASLILASFSLAASVASTLRTRFTSWLGDGAPRKRCCSKKTLVPRPTVKSLQRRNGAVPGRDDNLAGAGDQAARAVIGHDALPIDLPHGFAPAALGEKADPGDDVPAIRPNAVGRPHTHACAFAEEAIEIEVVASVVAKDEGVPSRSAGLSGASMAPSARLHAAPATRFGRAGTDVSVK